MKKLLTIFTLAAAGFCFIKATNSFLPKPTPVAFNIPKGWPQPVYDFSQNPLTEEGVALGMKLFYDERLSRDGTLSCASCHQQFAAFATFDHPLSHGIDNQFTKRNTPGLFNLAWRKEFMYDGSIMHLDAQPLAPLTAANEMGETVSNVIAKIKADKEYRSMFKAAFGDATINTQRMTKALSQFMLTMVSSNSKYDKVMRGEAVFTYLENEGYKTFKQKCASCHTEPFFTDFSYRNTGLALDTFLLDYGRMTIAGNASDSLKFMVPSLRNVRLTYPYMHDGRFYSLYDVLEHYNSRVSDGPTTDSLVRNKIPLKSYEVTRLLSFLYTLTDSTFIKDPRFTPAGFYYRKSDHH